MTKEEALVAFSKYGDVQILKKDFVFTLLLTGTELSKWETFNNILATALDFSGNKFPLIETIRNENGFFCLVLKPDVKKSLIKKEIKNE